jgi:Acyl-CoA dehydrogenases
MPEWKISEEQELLIESVREFCARNISETKIQEWLPTHQVPAEFSKAYVDAGFGFMGIPEEYGGTPADTLTQVIMMEEILRSAGAVIPSIGSALKMYDICEWGSPEQIIFFMDHYKKTGTCNIGLCISEPGAGSDNVAMVTTAKRVNGKVVISGSKTFCSNARFVDYFIVAAKDEDPARTSPMSLWLVRKDAPGVSLSPLPEIGFNLVPFSEVYFDNVVIEEKDILGERGKGFITLMKHLEVERIFALAQVLGLAQAAMDDAAAYASQRVVFGQPIGKFQLIQKKLVDMEVKLQNCRNLTYKTAYELDQGMSGQLSTALAKYYVPRACHEIADDAMHIMGGIGYTTDCRVSRIWQETKGYQFGGGTEEIMVYISGRQILKKYAK